jgi:cell wall-associated NlpC family hydrolase
VRDCYELGRDFFRDNFGIELTNYARPHDWSADTTI